MRMAKQWWEILLLAVLLTACAKAPDMVVQNGMAVALPNPPTSAPPVYGDPFQKHCGFLKPIPGR